jgi:hypothetical protein
MPAPFDAHANFANGVVLTAPSPATSGTSLVLQSGQGASFPATATGLYNLVVTPANQLPSVANSEVVRVTARATDTFTITRAQEGSSARSIGVGDWVLLAPTAKTFTDIEATTGAATPARMYRSAALAYAAGAITLMPFDTASYDPGSNLTVGASAKYTCPATGYYQVNVAMCFGEGGAQYNEMLGYIYKNGAAVVEVVTFNALETYGELQMTDIIACDAGDYLQAYFYNEEGPWNVVAGPTYTYMSVVRVA